MAMQPSTIRAWSFVHTWTSLVCTAFLLLLCVTGVAMIWIHEIDARYAAHPPVAQVAADHPPANLDLVFADAVQRTPGERVIYADWAFEGDLLGVNMAAPDNPKARRQLVYDARTGDFLEDTRKDNPNHPVRVFLRIMNRLHIQLFLGLPGEFFLASMTALFVVATVSGVVLYVPFTRKLDFGVVRSDRSSRAGWLDAHNLIGIATVGWVLVVAITGIMNAFTVPAYAAWRKATVPALVTPYKDQPLLQARIGAQAAKEKGEAANPGSRMVRITPPGGHDGSPRHWVVWTQGDTPVTKKLFRPVLVAADTGAVILSDPPPWWLSALQFSRPLHFGNYGGAPLKILWTILDLIAIGILVSGLKLFIDRRWRVAK
jgi:uncharacterized iron-regulated membrane protein